MLQELASILLKLGIVLVFFGSILWLLGKLPFLGKLPGDFVVKKENLTIYAPIATMVFLSIVFSLLLTIVSFFKKSSS